MPRHWSAGHIRSRLASSLHEVPRRYPWNFALFLFILSSHYGCLQPRTQSELPTEVPAATEETISPPNALAAFDADGTLWADDLGEAFFLEHLEPDVVSKSWAFMSASMWQPYLAAETGHRRISIALTRASAGLTSVWRKTHKLLILQGVSRISSGEDRPDVVFFGVVSQESAHFGSIFATLTS